jgi:hypothetical protein
MPTSLGLARDLTLTDGTQRIGGTIATSGTPDTRFAGGKIAYAAVVSAAGDTTVVTPTAGQKVRLVWVSFLPRSDNTAGNLVTVKLGTVPKYIGEALAHWELFDGGLGEALTVNLANAQPMAVNIHYQLI